MKHLRIKSDFDEPIYKITQNAHDAWEHFV